MKERTGLISILLLILVAALAYLPLINQIGYSYDDWYLMPSARAEGAEVFHAIYSVDRPGRAFLMIPAYMLFGENPLYYHLSAFFFRVAGALALLWLLNMLWPGRQTATTLMSLFFLIYPGFLSQPDAIDYQSHIIGLAAALGSIALTFKAITVESRVNKAILHIGSILLGWLYLSQMEWYIGFEFLRWACVFLLSSRSGGTLPQMGRRALQWAYPSLAVPLFFLAWRLFFFEGERGATDIDVQFELLKLYPIQTLYYWVVQVAQDLFDVLLAAWVIPLSQLTGYVQRWSGATAVALTALVLFVLTKFNDEAGREQALSLNFSQEALLLGFLSAAAGLLPIAMVNREVAFPFFSRYSLVSSVGVSIFIVAFLMNIKGRVLPSAILATLILIAMLTHHANSVKYALETSALKSFWWQVSWRAPQLQKGTTLIADYPVGGIEEDYFVWGPASLIYYPDKQNPEAIQPGLYAAVLNTNAIVNVLTRERQQYDNRKNIVTYPNYRNILVLSQPTSNSCVRVIDGNQPDYSPNEADSIRLVGTYSEIERVLTEETPHTPPEIVFGPEPAHDWCYYYQKADLARQRGDWEEVMSLGAQALEKGFAPQDSIEWMPFLQAYAATEDVDRLRQMAPIIALEPYISLQVCQHIGAMQDLSDPVREIVESLYCLE